MSIGKKVQGNKFILKGQRYSRPEANDLVRSLKHMGYLTKITKKKRRVAGEWLPVYLVWGRGSHRD